MIILSSPLSTISQPDLFKGCCWIISPHEKNQEESVKTIEELIKISDQLNHQLAKWLEFVTSVQGKGI